MCSPTIGIRYLVLTLILDTFVDQKSFVTESTTLTAAETTTGNPVINQDCAAAAGQCTDSTNPSCDGYIDPSYSCGEGGTTVCCFQLETECPRYFLYCDPSDPSQFQCDNNCCVPKSYECDNYQDCSDNSDEYLCPSKNPCLNFASYATCLYQKLFVNQTYYNHVLPLDIRSENAIEVIVKFAIRSLNDIDDVNQAMRVTGYISMTWVDPRLKWFTSDIPANDIVVPADLVWLPDVAITNSIEAFYDIRFHQEFRVRISNDGNVTWIFGGLFSTTCALDISNYPFDSQECFIQLENWQYSNSDVKLTVVKGARVDVDDYQPDSLWDLVDSSYNLSVTNGSGVSNSTKRKLSYPQLQIIFNWKRKPEYYVMNYVAPAILLTFITLAVFWVPAASGERIGLGITVLLSFTVYQIIITGAIPATSEQFPVLGKVILAMIVLATLSQLTSIIICIVDEETARPVPAVFKSLFFRRLAMMLCVRYEPDEHTPNEFGSKLRHSKIHPVEEPNRECNRCNGTTGDADVSLKIIDHTNDVGSRDDKTKVVVPTPAASKYSREWKAVIANIAAIRAILDTKEEESRIYQDWQRLAKVIDRLMFTTSVISFAVYIIVLATSLN